MTKDECEIETSKAIMEMRNHIAELEKENAELKAYNEKLLDGDIEKHNKIVELKAQIEKMKCCGNNDALKTEVEALKKCLRGIVYMAESGLHTKNELAFARCIAEAKELCKE